MRRGLLILLFAVLPFQWVTVRIPGLGAQKLHIVALVLFGLATLVWLKPRAFSPVLRIAGPLIVAMVVLIMVWLATNLYHATSPRPAIQEAVLMATFLPLATVIYRAVRYPESGVLDAARWCGLASNVALVGGLAFAMRLNGVDPLAVISDTIASGDPNILQREVFVSALQGFGTPTESLRSNIRHEIVGAVLVAALLSVAAERLRPLRSGAAKLLFRASLVVSVTLVILSLSRSVTLALLAWPVLALLRAFQAGRVSTRQGVALAVGALGVAVLAQVGFLSVLAVRFTEDTSSYDAREGLLSQAYSNIATHWLTGGVDTVGQSAHNFVLDTWLRTGLFGAAAAAVITVVLLGLWLSFVLRLHREPDWIVAVVAALTLALVRMFTAGGGSIYPVEWVCFAVVAGFLAARRWPRPSVVSRRAAPVLVPAARHLPGDGTR